MIKRYTNKEIAIQMLTGWRGLWPWFKKALVVFSSVTESLVWLTLILISPLFVIFTPLITWASNKDAELREEAYNKFVEEFNAKTYDLKSGEWKR